MLTVSQCYYHAAASRPFWYAFSLLILGNCDCVPHLLFFVSLLCQSVFCSLNKTQIKTSFKYTKWWPLGKEAIMQRWCTSRHFLSLWSVAVHRNESEQFLVSSNYFNFIVHVYMPPEPTRKWKFTLNYHSIKDFLTCVPLPQSETSDLKHTF